MKKTFDSTFLVFIHHLHNARVRVSVECLFINTAIFHLSTFCCLAFILRDWLDEKGKVVIFSFVSLWIKISFFLSTEGPNGQGQVWRRGKHLGRIILLFTMIFCRHRGKKMKNTVLLLSSKKRNQNVWTSQHWLKNSGSILSICLSVFSFRTQNERIECWALRF